MAPFETPILPLLNTVFASILEVFLLCLAGYILASRGILDRRTQKQLNHLNVSLFTPSLLFSKVAFFLSPAKLKELWIIPLFFVLVTIVSMVVSFLLGVLFRLKRSQRSFAMAASMFMNSNSLPIALMQSLVITVPGLKWGKDDNKNAMVGRALTYLVLYSTLGMILRWSYGVRLLAQADPEPVDDTVETTEASLLISQDETSFPSSSAEQIITQHKHSDSDEEEILPEIRVMDNDRLRPRPNPLRAHASFFQSFPNSPARTPPETPTPNPLSLADSGDEESDDDELPSHIIPRHREFTLPTSTRSQSFLRRFRRRISKALTTLNQFMTVPLWASLASLVVACIGPFQHALDEHMQPVKGALSAAGNCSIPLTLVVLGAYFYTPPEAAPSRDVNRHLSTATSTSSLATLMGSMKDYFKMKSKRHTPGTRRTGDDALLAASRGRSRPGETKTVIIAIVSRMIITPLLLLPLMALSTKFDLQSVFDDPVFVVANVLLMSSPPALTLAQITQAASGDAFERLISRTIFWAYCVVTPPATIIYVVIGLLLSKL